MVQTLEKKTDFKKKKEKKKKSLSKEDETKEECYRFADAWVVWEEEWKELKKKKEKRKKKKDDIYDTWEGFKANLAFNNWN